MARQIFEVYAKIVDANGSYNTLSGYPKTFDSRNYNDDGEKALKRARAEYHNTLGTMYTRDDRLLQTVLLMSAYGMIIESEHVGVIEAPSEPEEPGAI